MALPRTLEPEVMDTVEEAVDYNAMDHSAVNTAFVDDFLEATAGTEVAQMLADPAQPATILDTGTGTALIPLELCRRPVHCRITAIDLATEMLRLAEENVRAAGCSEQITLERVDCKQLPWPDATFDAVVSNSIIHHIPEPQTALAEMLRVLRPDGVIFVRDLCRPDDESTLEQLVTTYAGEENEHQQRMFRESLHAALTVAEGAEMLRELGVDPAWIRPTSDRHWTISGVR